MSGGDFLNIQPLELRFPFELGKRGSCSLQLTNKTNKYVAFKLQSTYPIKYGACPNTGIVLPGTTCDVTVTMAAPKEAPQDMQCEDLFLIQSVIAPKGATAKDITPEMFDKERVKVEAFILNAIYVPVTPLVLIGSSPGTSDAASNSPLMSSGDLLRIQLSEFKFPFELEKQSSCSLQLVPEGSSRRASGVANGNLGTYSLDATIRGALQQRSLHSCGIRRRYHHH